MNKAKKITSILSASFMFATAFATVTLVHANKTTVKTLDGLKLVSEEKATLANLASKKNAAVETTVDKESAYYSVRLGEDAGLRFKYSLTKDMLAKEFTNVDMANYTYGVYVAKTVDLAGATLTSKISDNTVKKLNVTATNKIVTEDDVTFAAVLVGFNDEAKYNTEFSSVAYVTNGEKTVYSAESSYSYMKAINYYLDDSNEVHSQLSDAQVTELTALKEDNEVGYRVVEEDSKLKLYQYGVKSDNNVGTALATVDKPNLSTATYTVDLKNKGASTDSGTLYAFTQQGNVYTSSNQKKGLSNAAMVVTATSAGTISFDYDVQGEANYDYLTVFHNKNYAQNSEKKDMYKLSSPTGVTGSASIDVEEGDTLTFSYRKDSGGDKGEDRAIINIAGSTVLSSVVTYDALGGGVYNPSITLSGSLVGTMPTPTKTGYYFEGWYSDSTFAEDSKVDNFSLFQENAVVYAHWLDMKDASPLMGTHYGFDVYGTGLSASKTASYNPHFTVDFTGNYTATYSGSSSSVRTGKLGTYDEVSKSYGGKIYYDADEGLIVMAQSDTTPLTSTYFSIYTVGATASPSSTSNYTSIAFDSGKYRYVEFGTKAIYIDVLANKVYFGVKAYGIDNTQVKGSSITSQLAVTIKQADTVLKTFGYAGSSSMTATTIPSGVYTVANSNDTVQVSGSGYLVYSKYNATSKIKYTLVDNQENVLNATSSSSYNYTFTIDETTKTVEVVENKYAISYEWNGHTISNITQNNYPSSVWKGSWLYVPSKPAVDSYVEDAGKYYVFKGWYTDEELTILYKQKQITDDTTLYAKWVEGYKLTFDANSGTCKTTELVVVSRETPELPEATHSEKSFIGWFNGDVEYTNETVVTENVALVAKWKDAPFFVGKYAGYNVDHSNYGYQSGSSLAYILTLTPDGKVTDKITTTWTESKCDVDNKLFTFDNGSKFHILVSSTGIVVGVAQYSLSTTSDLKYDDYGIYAKYTEATGKPSFKVIYWNDGYDKLIEVTVGSNVTYVYTYGDKDAVNCGLYIDVTTTDFAGNPIAFADIYKDKALTSELVIKTGENIVGKFKATDSTDTKYGYKGYDGLSGTYTGSLNGTNSTVAIDGFGYATLNGVVGTYTYSNDTFVVVVENVTYEFTVSGSSLTQKLDGTEGTYSGASGELVLTGYGVATLGGTEVTYTVSGTLVKLAIGEKITYVSIDKDANSYVVETTSKFSACLFEGSSKCNEFQGRMKISFDEGAAITGVIGFNNSVKADDYNAGVFEGVYDNVTKTLTLTIVSVKSGNELVGKVYVFSVADGKLTFVSTTATRNIFQVNANYTLSCEGFTA